MKKLISLLFTLLLFSNTVFAFPNEPEGFRELKWGDSVQTLLKYYPDATFEKTLVFQNDLYNNIKFDFYKVSLKNRNLSSLKLEKDAAYVFHNNQFVGVTLGSKITKSLSDFKNIESKFINNMFLLYGNPAEICTTISDTKLTHPKYITYRSWYNKTNEDNKNSSIIILAASIMDKSPQKEHAISVTIFKRYLFDVFIYGRLNDKKEIENQGW